MSAPTLALSSANESGNRRQLRQSHMPLPNTSVPLQLIHFIHMQNLVDLGFNGVFCSFLSVRSIETERSTFVIFDLLSCPFFCLRGCTCESGMTLTCTSICVLGAKLVLEQLRLVCSWVLAIFVCALVRTLILADFRLLVASDVDGGFLRITEILGITGILEELSVILSDNVLPLTSLAVPISFCHNIWLFIWGLDGGNDERTPPSSNWDCMLHKAESVIRLSDLSSAMVGDFERGDEFRMSSNVLLIQSTSLCLFILGNDI